LIRGKPPRACRTIPKIRISLFSQARNGLFSRHCLKTFDHKGRNQSASISTLGAANEDLFTGSVKVDDLVYNVVDQKQLLCATDGAIIVVKWARYDLQVVTTPFVENPLILRRTRNVHVKSCVLHLSAIGGTGGHLSGDESANP
jgi:hypothetical protein